MDRKTGKYIVTSVAGETVRAFVPAPLPPRPAIKISGMTERLFLDATAGLSQLNLAAAMIPDKEMFIYGFVRKEAVLTSQIEGYQPTLTDLFSVETKNLESNLDLAEACNYLEALEYSRAELQKPKGLPLSLRLLKQTHKRLMKGVRGAHKQPGSFRTSQNWIGGTRPGNAVYVPPPPDKVMDCLDNLEKYIHAKNQLPALIRIGLIHVQFETIHPFLDGNGRLGRLLIALLLEQWGLLDSPLLYISLYFKRHRQEYYGHLSSVRQTGDWEGWTNYFLRAVATISREAASNAKVIFAILEGNRKKLLDNQHVSISSMRLLEQLPRHPVITLQSVVDLLGTTKPTATKAISLLSELGILRETETEKRPRVFEYRAYLDVLKEET